MLFSLGRIVATPAALQHLIEAGIPPGNLLDRHAVGDWGDLDDEDKLANRSALKNGGRVLSAYQIGTTRIYIITESDRSYTTLLLAREY